MVAEHPLGPLCEGAPAAAGGGENLTATRNISGHGKALSLRPCGATSLAEGGKQARNLIVKWNNHLC